MYLTEKHIINKNHSFFNECDSLCFKSKNLYNQSLYNVRQYFFENKKYLNFANNWKITKEQEPYIKLPRKVSNQTIKLVDQNFKSFFSLLKNKNSGTYKEKVKIPQYLDKENGRYITIYEKQALSKRIFKKNGKIHLSQTEIYINTQLKDWDVIKLVRIIPRSNHYVIEVVYEKQEKTINSNNNYASIDLGLNNLATITFNNKNLNPIIINGKPLKNINQYYNKKRGFYGSILEKENKTKKSKRLVKITNKRNNKINDYLHKSSRILVNQLVSNQITKLVIGKNVGQKQDINMGKKNNQNFISVPIFGFINIIKYKCELEGIEVIIQEESYTSKASFLDLDDIPIYGKSHSIIFSGKRIKRGLYKTNKGILINSDVNGSYNIMRKAIPNAFADGTEGFAVNPIKLEIGL
ncbi:MAG: transposase [Peptostreptococcales bacterium]